MDSAASTSNEGDLVIVEDSKEMVSPKDQSSLKNRCKNRVKKRKRVSSDSSIEDVLPENMLDMEKNLQAAAIKNNLDDASVKKILKKVVTNDHVLALVKLREEEELSIEEPDVRPKLTRAKAKELMKVSPKSNAPWNLENLALTPIKHIPVKTRPEVKALIAQELPDDEDDEEYQPTHDDVPSDDDHTESDITFSDADSQPRTPAAPLTPSTPTTPSGRDRSPRPIRDGPFKVPQEIKTASRATKDGEEATIALRTRSKLSLSATPIEHIESSFIPPDEVMPVVDDLWSQFLETCLDPTWTTRVEDDDEADPEYNVAADPDANEEDEESLENSILKISKKELNDLVTELFHIMPEDLDNNLTDENGKNIANTGKGANGEVIENDTIEHVSVPVGHFEGKQEPVSDEEAKPDRVEGNRRFSIGKSEPMDCDSDPLAIDKSDEETEKEDGDDPEATGQECARAAPRKKGVVKKKKRLKKPPKLVQVHFKSNDNAKQSEDVVEEPSILKNVTASPAQKVEIVRYDEPVQMLPEQVLILQQQLRQHVQLATSNFLQLYVHPEHWRLGPAYKAYLESLYSLGPSSVARVCNLQPAVELVRSWEASVSENTPENIDMVEFLRDEIEKNRRRIQANNVYSGEFHPTLKKVIANSTVFLYPYLLPQVPYRCELVRRTDYRRAEDELIAMGLEQFFDYLKANPKLFEKNIGHGGRPENKGLTTVAQLICKLMLPPVGQRRLLSHIQRVRKDKDNPVYKYFVHGEVTPVKHKLLPYNDSITLYQQPEQELPVIWLRYIAQTSKTAKDYLRRRRFIVAKPEGVDVSLEPMLKKKPPKPISYSGPKNYVPIAPKVSNNLGPTIAIQLNHLPSNITRADVENDTNPQICTVNNNQNGTDAIASSTNCVTGLYTMVNTEKGSFLIPLQVDSTSTVTSLTKPITSAVENSPMKPEEKSAREMTEYQTHCKCCALIRKAKRLRQTTILNYFKRPVKDKLKCPCNSVESPRISHRLWVLVNNYHTHHLRVCREVHARTDEIMGKNVNCDRKQPHFDLSESERVNDIALAAAFQMKLMIKLSGPKYNHYKVRIRNLFQKFNPYSDCAVSVAKTIYKYFDKDLAELSQDFAAFLTAAQAEETSSFRDYFVQNCMVNLLRKVDVEISDVELKSVISQKLIDLLTNETQSSCDIFCDLYPHFVDYPKLAEYLFSLFPHRKKMRISEQTPSEEPAKEIPRNSTTTTIDQSIVDSTRISECSNIDDVDSNDRVRDYEADQSSDGEDDDEETLVMDTTQIPNSEDTRLGAQIKREKSDSIVAMDTEELTIRKTENQDSDSDRLHLVMSEDESIKMEPIEWNGIEWSKNEDKIILQMLKDHFTSDERKDLNTVLDNLDEMDIFKVLSGELIHRSVFEIRERVSYLLELLAIVESD